jgi:hypothetical protein
VSESGIERRRHARVEASVDVHGQCERGEIVARMVTNNLSMAGLHCTSTTDVPEMTRLAVRLLLPSGNGQGLVPIELEAVVVRRVPASAAASGEARFDLALFFTRVDDSAKQHLSSFIQSL